MSTDVVTFTGTDPTGGRLIAWAEAAQASHQLAQSLVRTQIVPDQFRVNPGMNPQEVERITGNAAAAILLGDELGLTPLAAMRSLFVIRGTVGMYARSMVALVVSKGHAIWTEDETPESVTVCGYRRNTPDHIERSTWTTARARAEGYARNEAYRNHPAAMLYARAASDVARRVAPDVLLGVPMETADELGAVTGGTEGGAASLTVQRRPRVAALGKASNDPPPPGGIPGGSDDDGPLTDVTSDPPEEEQNDTHVIPSDEDAEPLISEAQLRKLQVVFVQVGVRGSDARHNWLTRFLGRQIDATNDLTVTEASAVIERLERQLATADDDGRRDL